MSCTRFITFALILTAALLVPTAYSHAAGGITDTLNTPGPVTGTMLALINFGLDLTRGLVTFVIGQVSFILQAILGLHLGTGGDVVYTVWKNIRDFCNMAFIAVLILMSFGTIFDVFKIPFIGAYSINAKGVVANFLIAALLLNFSLAIGQTITGISDQVTTIVLRILPPDSISELMGRLEIATLSSDPSLSDTPILSNNVPAGAQKTFQDCIASQPSAVRDCYQKAVNQAVPQSPGFLSRAATLGQQVASQVFPNAYRAVSFGVFLNQAWNVSQQAGNAASITGGVGQILGKLYAIILLLAALLSFLVVAAFLFVRIPITWVLLAISPVAFVSLAFPGADGWGKWWKEMIKWSIFSPLYLLVIYFGMFMVNKMGLLVAALSVNGNTPIIAGFLAPLLNFIVIGIVFVGGAAEVLSIAKAGGTSAGAVAGAIAGGLGVTGTYGAIGAVGTGARATAGFAGRELGISPNVQAARERLQQQGRDITAGLRGRFPTVFGTQEQAIAKARQRLGVRTPEKESDYEKLAQKQIEDNRKLIEQPNTIFDTTYGVRLSQLQQQLNTLQARSNQATSVQERQQFQDQIKEVKDQQTEDLKKLLTSSNRDVALAAGEKLLADNKLSAPQMRDVARRYATEVSPIAATEFAKRRDTALIKNAGKQKFSDDLEKATAEIKEFVSVIGDTKKAEEYYKGLKGGKSKLAALQVGAELGLEKKSGGQNYTFNELAVREAPKFTPEDWLNVENALSKQAKDANRRVFEEMGQISPKLRDAFFAQLLNPKTLAKMLGNSTRHRQTIRVIQAAQEAEKPENKDRLRKQGQAQRAAELVFSTEAQKAAAEGAVPEKKGGEGEEKK